MNVRFLTLVHLVLTELRPFYAILFSANLMMKSALTVSLSIFNSTKSWASTDSYSVSLLYPKQCMEKIATLMVWAGTSNEFKCTFDKLDVTALSKGTVKCTEDPCKTETITYNGPNGKWRGNVDSAALLSIDFLVTANYIISILTILILVTVSTQRS
jgi:hypothetical protein